uniref:Cell division protein Ftn2 n=1 Tax=Paulinella chromatophora TaxID=39717 RepID=B1X3Q9_PAUCH|nr:Cell division protein Ftn2 [Paulinella chromatophora]ACB42578.1 Cell division protein Ftn2 [Paulinella chromatophora]
MCSGEEGDLTLLITLACCAAATEDWEIRCYEKASLWLQQGIILIQRTGKLEGKELNLEKTFNFLFPYRILDLVSRDLTDRFKRKNELNLVVQLLCQSKEFKYSEASLIKRVSFQPFLTQIFHYLTIQEQFSIFLTWEQDQSLALTSLISYGQIASGFAQKKPELVFSALLRLHAFWCEKTGPGFACLQLLLGDVSQAESHFRKIKEFPNEMAKHSPVNDSKYILEVLYAYCSDWLNHEILTGYRDIQGTASLNRWFASENVQAYVEQNEHKRSHFYSLVSSPETSSTVKRFINNQKNVSRNFLSYVRENFRNLLLNYSSINVSKKSTDALLRLFYQKFSWSWVFGFNYLIHKIKLSKFHNRGQNKFLSIFNHIAESSRIKKQTYIRTDMLLILALASGSISIYPKRSNVIQKVNITRSQDNPSKQNSKIKSIYPQLTRTINGLFIPKGQIFGLNPSCYEVKNLINVWLGAKAELLKGNKPIHSIDSLVEKYLIEYIQKERLKDLNNNEYKEIKAEAISLVVTEQNLTGLITKTLILYSDKYSNKIDRTLSAKPERIFTVTYALRYAAGIWRLCSYLNRSFIC